MSLGNLFSLENSRSVFSMTIHKGTWYIQGVSLFVYKCIFGHEAYLLFIGLKVKIQKLKRTFQPVSDQNLERSGSGIVDTLCRIPISKPLTHRIILIKEKFSGMSLTRERTHELDKIFLHLFTFANKQWFSHSRQQILYSLPGRDPIWNVHSLIGQPFKVIIRIFWKFILIKNKFLSNY